MQRTLEPKGRQSQSKGSSERMAAVKCPKCKLENPATAERCDCGYDFAGKVVKASYLELDKARSAREKARLAPQPSEEVRQKGRQDMLFGGVALALGLSVTVVTYRFAESLGGAYIIAKGAIVFGALWFIRGVDRSRSGVERRFWGKLP